MPAFREHRFWSPMLGCDATRLSMTDARGGEFFKIIPVQSGVALDRDGKRVPRYRVDRDAALDAIEDAVASGQEPGEVG